MNSLQTMAALGTLAASSSARHQSGERPLWCWPRRRPEVAFARRERQAAEQNGNISMQPGQRRRMRLDSGAAAAGKARPRPTDNRQGWRFPPAGRPRRRPAGSRIGPWTIVCSMAAMKPGCMNRSASPCRTRSSTRRAAPRGWNRKADRCSPCAPPFPARIENSTIVDSARTGPDEPLPAPECRGLRRWPDEAPDEPLALLAS